MANSTTTTTTSGVLLSDGTRLIQENIPIASYTTAGIVKPDGDTITVEADGTIISKGGAVDGALTVVHVSSPLTGVGTQGAPITIATGNGLVVKSGKIGIDSNYTDFYQYYTKSQIDASFARKSDIPDSLNLSPATTSTLGSIIVGNGLSVTNNGVLSVTATPPATKTSSGVVKVGNGLSVTADGTISVVFDSASLNDYYTKQQANDRFALKESIPDVSKYLLDVSSATAEPSDGGMYDEDAAYLRQSSKWVPLSKVTASTVMRVTSFSGNTIRLSTELIPVMLQSADGKNYAIDCDDFQISNGVLTIDTSSALCLWNMPAPKNYMYVYLLGNTVVK